MSRPAGEVGNGVYVTLP